MASLPFAELQLSNEDNKPVQRGMAGEIVASCDRRMRGFGTTPKRRPSIVSGWRRRSLDADDDLYSHAESCRLARH